MSVEIIEIKFIAFKTEWIKNFSNVSKLKIFFENADFR